MSSEKSKGSTVKIPGAVKYDQGKSPMYRGGLSYFPNAIGLVASISLFGATKYAWEGWRHVDDGFNRYSDAMVRHLGQEREGEGLDANSGLPHIGHACWNSLARTELWLAEQRQKGDQH